MPTLLGIILIMKEIVLLGSTGSIGVQSLDVAELNEIKVKAISAHNNIRLLEQQARRFKVKQVCISDENMYSKLKTMLADTSVQILCGKEGLCEIAALSCDTVVNAVVGMAGFMPTLSAIKAGNQIALANKETLVVGGEIVMRLAKEKKVDILPIDSEHSAIFQSLLGSNGNKPEKIILTASGGPFLNFSHEQLKRVTKTQALRHPNWSMGAKITIDSATMMNKGLELIEAVRLFNVTPEQIEIVVHPQSILHSAVEFADGAVIGQLGVPDMKIPIQLALTYPNRAQSASKRLSLTEIGKLTFFPPDEETFVSLRLAREAVKRGGNMPCIMNGANEAAVSLFLQDKISFCEITDIIQAAMQQVAYSEDISAEIIINTEKEINKFIHSYRRF